MSANNIPHRSGFSRREFLQSSSVGLGMAGMGLGASAAVAQSTADSSSIDKQQVIVLFLTGGPSQLDTWDPKPEAPAEIRGPFSAINTKVPGIQLTEHFPLMAQRADKFALIRGLYHEESPIHETGHQLVNTGFLFRGGVEHPSVGSVVQHVRNSQEAAGYVVLGGRLGNTGVNVAHGQDAGLLGSECDPAYLSCANVFTDEPDSFFRRYGKNPFGENCLAARRLVESGVDFVTVNMFDSVFGKTTWDCHANGGDLATTLDDYKSTVCPMFDRAYTALLDDLGARGLLETTLVLAVGEFGRTPRLNPRGGRDHWPGVWTALAAGGNIVGGRTIGSSDKNGAEPQDRPVHASELAATIHGHMGIKPHTKLSVDRDATVSVAQADPITELFA